ncbi:Ras GTPase-activating protein nGAP [Dissostichus eleginoides]|uniref:Ras GTPase-activating protein nGAP n=1 Tax=Dissostichus eleginoides TaxID=100907 RepID=A0AAD9B834_DISEL|nr:Ras GTPase-activating protein nGAP [Dissostichus eleginoides]
MSHFVPRCVFAPTVSSSLDHTAVNLTSCPAPPPPLFFPSLSNQERRIDSLDAANSRLMAALTQVKERYNTPSIHNGLSPSNPTKLSITETGEFKNSSC